MFARPIAARFVPLVASLGAVSAGCANGTDPAMRNDLSTMPTARIAVKGRTVEVWLATRPAEQQRGLMQVRQDALTPLAPDAERELPDGAERGMLFVFPTEQLLAFWMYNTVIPLDIAYLRRDGVIVKTYTMAPLETRLYPSVEPAQFALEVRAGLWAELGVRSGDRVEMPDAVLKASR